MKLPNGPWKVISSPSAMSQRWFDMNPSCTRFKQNANLPYSLGSEAMEYARVISSPSGVDAFSESHCPGTNSRRGVSQTANSRCLV